MLTNFRFLMLAFVATLGTTSATVQAQSQSAVDRPPELSDGGGSIPVNVIDGRLVVACDISGPRLRAPINLWLDFDGAYGLQLHDRAASNLPAEDRSGRPLPLTLHFPDFTLKVARRERGPEKAFEDFTKYHSEALGENALSGAIGANILKHFDVIFDLPNGQVSLVEAGQLNSTPPDSASGEVMVEISLQDDVAWLPIQLGGPNNPLKQAFAIGTSRYDSVLDRTLCRSLGRPAGNVGAVTCDSIDFSPFVAFRPDDVFLKHPEGAAGVMGLNLLECFRIHVDRQTLRATIRQASRPKFPEEEFAWFQAMIAQERDPIVQWLQQHGDSRLGREAAELLLALTLSEGVDDSQFTEAIQWVNDTMPKDLRATRMLALLEELVAAGKTDLGVAAGKVGVESARKDRYPDTNYKLHGRLGELLLDSDLKESWRHLLSAAFGLPEDGMINLNLARVYEANGKKKRAFSRYIQALIKEESSELAMEALMRMDKELPSDERMTIETIDRMISGRVRNFSAPDQFIPDDQRGNHVALVEFFTNAYVGNESRGGAIGGAMGNQGVMTHFGSQDCLFLSYHLTVPRIDPLANSLGQFMAEWLGVNGPIVQVVDGANTLPGAGKHRDAEKIYKATRDMVSGRLKKSTTIGISSNAKLEGKSLSGNVVIKGPSIGSPEDIELPPIVIQVVVAERGVVFHGSSGVVIHRMLARGLATQGPQNGIPFLPDEEGQLVINFERNLSEIEKENTAYLDGLEEGQSQDGARMGLRIEPKSVEIIVVARNAETGEVLQAAQSTLERVEIKEPGNGA